MNNYREENVDHFPLTSQSIGVIISYDFNETYLVGHGLSTYLLRQRDQHFDGDLGELTGDGTPSNPYNVILPSRS